MSAVVKLSTKLPGDEETNGLDSLAEQLVKDPETVRVAIVWLDVSKVTTETDSHQQIPTVRVRRVEPLGDVDDVSKAIRELVDKAVEARTGKTPLPFDVTDYEDETL